MDNTQLNNTRAYNSIKEAAIDVFAKHIELRQTKRDSVFRRTVMNWLMENYECTDAAAATHYNTAKKYWTNVNPEMVKNLGRPEGKNNGGPKKKVAVFEVPKQLFPIVDVSEVSDEELAEDMALLQQLESEEQLQLTLESEEQVTE